MLQRVMAAAVMIWSATLSAEEAAKECPPGMARVPGGAFTPAGKPHVTVPDLCMDATEVTVAQYAACTTCTAPKTTEFCNWGVKGKDDHPVNCVTWAQSDAYCKAQGKRLPTEWEWEWAARGGVEGWARPWGKESAEGRLCWKRYSMVKAKSFGTCPAASFPQGDSPQGIHDLAGNVWEWTSSAAGPGTRVFRGSGWRISTANSILSGMRVDHAASGQFFDLGFRCVKEP